jgi:hypothetical protein
MHRWFRPSTRRPSVAFLVLAGLVVTGSIAIRLALLGRQSYWIDELFSANQSDGSLRTMLKIGSTEVHTPFYAALLWLWMKLGNQHEVWTRLLSTLCAVAAVLVAHRGLRCLRLDQHVRWALTVATAASGTSIVYSVETRSYALLLLGSVGLTIATVHAGLLTLNREDIPRRRYLTWTGWVLLAATAHLFGAVLTFAAVTVLGVITLRATTGPRPALRRLLVWVALAAAGCSLQLAWLLTGLSRPGFAAGTDWIQAPDRYDVRDLVTTTFSSGALTPHKDGFAWASPIGTVLAVALCLAAIGHRYWSRSRRTTTPATEATGQTPELQAAGILLALAAVVIAFSFAVSQHTHLWTLRNLVIVSPALLWGAICLAAGAAGTAAGRQLVATAVVAMLGLSLVPSTFGLAEPYKTDFRGLLEYLIEVRTQEPGVKFVFLGRDSPGRWQAASDRADDDPAWATLYGSVVRYRRAASYPGAPKQSDGRSPGPEIVVYYHGVANPNLDREASQLVARLGPDRCRTIPIHGIIVVRCN